MASEQLIETWVLYSFGSLVIFARIAVRWRMVGVRGFMPDDYLIFLSWVRYSFSSSSGLQASKRRCTHMTYDPRVCNQCRILLTQTNKRQHTR